MATFSDHLIQAEHNKSLADKLIESKPIVFKDWAVVVAFYSAVHFIEGYRDKKLKQHSRDHLERRDYVVRNFANSFTKSYIKLYELSRMLRYLEYDKMTYAPKGTWLNDCDAETCITVNLVNIKDDVIPILKSA